MKKLRILSDSFATNAGGIAERVLEGGSLHPLTDAKAQHAFRYGNAVEVDVPDEKPETDVASVPSDPAPIPVDAQPKEPAPVQRKAKAA